MNRTLNYIILLLLIISFYGFIRIFNSYNQQLAVLADLNNDSWDRPIEFFESMEVDFPNLTATALPLKAAQAQYYLYNDSIVKGLTLVDEVIAEKSNPFIMLPEALKAKYFNTMGQKDSAYYYSRKAFSGLPRNPFHIAELIRSLNSEQKKDSIDEYFKQVKYPFNYQVWRIYLAAALGEDSDNEFAKETAIEAIEITQNRNQKNDLLRITSFMNLYGKDIFEKSLEIENNANNYYNQDNFEEAKILYENLIELIPANFMYKENLAVCLFNLKVICAEASYRVKLKSSFKLFSKTEICFSVGSSFSHALVL